MFKHTLQMKMHALKEKKKKNSYFLHPASFSTVK